MINCSCDWYEAAQQWMENLERCTDVMKCTYSGNREPRRQTQRWSEGRSPELLSRLCERSLRCKPATHTKKKVQDCVSDRKRGNISTQCCQTADMRMKLNGFMVCCNDGNLQEWMLRSFPRRHQSESAQSRALPGSRPLQAACTWESQWRINQLIHDLTTCWFTPCKQKMYIQIQYLVKLTQQSTELQTSWCSSSVQPCHWAAWLQVLQPLHPVCRWSQTMRPTQCPSWAEGQHQDSEALAGLGTGRPESSQHWSSPRRLRRRPGTVWSSWSGIKKRFQTKSVSLQHIQYIVLGYIYTVLAGDHSRKLVSKIFNLCRCNVGVRLNQDLLSV